MDNLTVVSGYWPVVNKYNDGAFKQWMNNTLRINQRYIFFCDEQRTKKDEIQSFRGEYETVFMDHPLDSFYTRQYASKSWMHPYHIPSVELGMIWHEKVHLMKLARDYDVARSSSSCTDFYIWVDAGIAPYRWTQMPQVRLNLKDVNALPHDKLCYGSVYTTYHWVSGGVFIMHKDIIDTIHDLYYKELESSNNYALESWRCGSDQYIFTRVMQKYPHLFFRMTDGYTKEDRKGKRNFHLTEGFGQALVELFETYV